MGHYGRSLTFGVIVNIYMGRLPRIRPIQRGRGRERGHLKPSVDTNLSVAYFTSALIN